MKNNFFMTMSGLHGEEQKKFDAWLTQYEAVAAVDQVFEEHPDLLHAENTVEDLSALRALGKNDTSVPAPGQIRRLHQNMTTDHGVMTAVLVLTQWSGQYWLVAPFSPFTIPATPGELTTGIDFSAYQVVEVWNAVAVPDVFLRTKTSFLRNADEALRKDACVLFFQQLEGTELSADLQKRVGPAIKSDLDPRVQYLLNEQLQIQPARTEVEKAEEFFGSLQKIEFQAFFADEESGLLAAKDKGDTNSFFAVDRHCEVLNIYTQDKEIRIRVYEDVSRKNYSCSLDGCHVLSETGVVLGTISKGKCLFVKPDNANALCLSDPDGNLFALTSMKE